MRDTKRPIFRRPISLLLLTISVLDLEATAGIEPAFTDLQSAA